MAPCWGFSQEFPPSEVPKAPVPRSRRVSCQGLPFFPIFLKTIIDYSNNNVFFFFFQKIFLALLKFFFLDFWKANRSRVR